MFGDHSEIPSPSPWPAVGAEAAEFGPRVFEPGRGGIDNRLDAVLNWRTARRMLAVIRDQQEALARLKDMLSELAGEREAVAAHALRVHGPLDHDGRRYEAVDQTWGREIEVSPIPARDGDLATTRTDNRANNFTND